MRAFGYKRELKGGERIIVFPMVKRFELIAIAILCLSSKAFVMYKV